MESLAWIYGNWENSSPKIIMTILKDTKIKLVSFSKGVDIDRLFNIFAVHNLKVKEKSRLTLRAKNQLNPIIWLLVFDNQQQIIDTEFRRYHANKEAFIYLVKDDFTDLNKRIEHPILLVNCPIETLQKTLLYQEQRILQRNLFQSSTVDDDLFLQLNFYGRSTAYVDLMEMIKCIAKTDAGVFIKGQTGTGKELAARSIHYLSGRKTAPFIPINCGAFNDDLILSELFGYEKGAFTGATKSKQGLLESANRGTVFLDEIDSLSAKAQVALLRYLQDSELRPIGSNEIKKIDVRVVAASNKNIKKLIREDKFREDLFYRIDVLTVNLPPLNQREEDIQLIAQYFLAQLAINNKNTTKVFSREILVTMQNYLWPGNVRELDNFVKRAYFLTKGDIIQDVNLLKDMRQSVSQKSGKENKEKPFFHSFSEEKKTLVNRFEKDYLNQLLRRTQGNISKAASFAQKERRSFCRLMKKHGLERKSYL